MKNTRTLLALLSMFLLLFCSACNSDDDASVDDCPAGKDLGTFSFHKFSLDFIPQHYQNTNTRLIFSDSSGIEFTAQITNYKMERGVDLSTTFFCKNLKTVTNTYTGDRCKIEMYFSELDCFIDLVLKTDVYNHLILSGSEALSKSDRLTLKFDGKSTSAYTSLNVYNQQNDFVLRETYDFETIKLFNKTFNEVFLLQSISSTGPKSNFFYTKELGIVGIDHEDIKLKLERIE